MTSFVIRTETVDQAFFDFLELLMIRGDRVDIETDAKGKRSGGATIELRNTSVLVENLRAEINVPTELSNVTEKFMNGMLFRDTEKPQSKRVMEQKESVIDLLRSRSHTRKASIAVWERSDLTAPYSVCLAYMQFLIRNDKLYQSVVFRSWDIWNAFLWNCKGCIGLQTEIAEQLVLQLGTFSVFTVSGHVYKLDEKKVREFLMKKWKQGHIPKF